MTYLAFYFGVETFKNFIGLTLRIFLHGLTLRIFLHKLTLRIFLHKLTLRTFFTQVDR